MMDIRLYTELLELLNNQGKIIAEQNEIIFGLVNENAEKENFIKTLWKEEVQNFLDADEIEI